MLYSGVKQYQIGFYCDLFVSRTSVICANGYFWKRRLFRTQDNIKRGSSVSKSFAFEEMESDLILIPEFRLLWNVYIFSSVLSCSVVWSKSLNTWDVTYCSWYLQFVENTDLCMILTVQCLDVKWRCFSLGVSCSRFRYVFDVVRLSAPYHASRVSVSG